MKKNDKMVSEDPHLQDQKNEEDDSIIGRAFFLSLLVIVPVLMIVVGMVVIMNLPEPEEEVVETEHIAPEVRNTDEARVPQVNFTDITQSSGVLFKHENGAKGEKLLPETMGGGNAFFDFDNDGDQDLLLVNSCHWPGQQPADQSPPTMALFRNDGKGNFENVTEGSGLDVTFYGMGAAVGDYDNDGWVDVYISAVGKNRLFRNVKGKFVDITAEAGVSGGNRQWSTSCGWLDYNNDGLLDLFVCNYVRWTKEIDSSLDVTLDGVNRAYGPPTSFEGDFPYLFRNDGQGKFTDVSGQAGLQVKNPDTAAPISKSLGTTFIDLDQDGWMDIIAANDTVQNLVFHNQKNGTFEEIGTFVGVAYDTSGNARGAMGIDSAFFRNDKALGVAIGNFTNEMTSLYVTQGEMMQFSDEAIATGLGPKTRLELTFGLFFFDYDLDGRLDLVASNGHLENEISKVQASQQYEQPPQLFWNAGADLRTEFVAVEAESVGSDFHKRMVGRGATYADIDGDGDLDLLLTSTGAEPRLLRNDQQLDRHWLRLKLVGEKCNRDAIGAWVDVQIGDQTLRRQVMPTRSYLSQVELPITIGLGKTTKIDQVMIRWPDGTQQELLDPQLDQLQIIKQSE